MNFIEQLTNSISPEPIYQYTYQLISTYLVVLSPTLLVLAILFRSQLITIKSFRGESGQLREALIDIALYGTLLVAYIGFCSILLEFVKGLYDFLNKAFELQSMRSTVEQMFTMAEKIERTGFSKWMHMFKDKVANLTFAIPNRLSYLWSFMKLTSVQIVVDIAKAFVLCLSLVLGTIVIPLHISGIIGGLLQKWLNLMAFAMGWQAVDYIIQALLVAFSVGFVHNSNELIQNITTIGVDSVNSFYIATTIFNYLCMGGILLAPFLTIYLVSSGGKATGAVMAAGGALGGTTVSKTLMRAATPAKPAPQKPQAPPPARRRAQ